ncbi:MAG: SURF1 family protein [Pseudomonadota bacterium]
MAEVGRPLWVNLLLLLCASAVFGILVSLGIWQLHRLSWKLDLIERVETRAFGEPVAVPVGPDPPEYLRVGLSGSFRHDLSLRVKAVTELGPGHWVLTPIETEGETIWINRGFVGDQTEVNVRPEGRHEVTGLIRLSQPGGTMLERNDPENDRWVSADIAAMSAHVGISATAGFYIDADHQGATAGWPRGGMTRVEFRNSHLSYALTWFAMAALFAVAIVYVIRDVWRHRTNALAAGSRSEEPMPPKVTK